jgi:ATP-binding cassette, subfamily B, multidrug efflux pump
VAFGQYKTAHDLDAQGHLAGKLSERFVYKEERVFEKPFEWRQAVRLWQFIKPYRPLVATGVLFMTLATLARLAIPLLIAKAVDLALRDGVQGWSWWNEWLRPFEREERLFWIAGVMAAVHLVGWGANYLRIRITNRVGQHALYDLRQKLFSHIQTLSFKFFDGRPAGAILVRVTNDVNSLQDLFTNGIISLVQDLFTLVGIVIIMFSLNAPLALVCFLFLPFMITVTGRLRNQIRRGWQLVRIKQSRMTAHVAEAIQGIRVTEAFVQEEENKEFFQQMNADNRRSWIDVLTQNAYFQPIVEMMAATGTMVVYWYGTTILRDGGITVGLLFAFVAYLGNFWEPIQRLTQLYGNVLVAMASSERIFEYLDTKPTVSEEQAVTQLPPIEGRVELEDVVFQYEEGRVALNGVSLHVEPGQTVALVGHTGAGKTSIINLLCRFYDVTEGAVRFDGHDVRQVTLESLRRQIGVVLQDTFIFSGTIMENIRFGRLDATDEEVIAAATAARAHEFIGRLPDGYQTEVKERGARLSMGERQLLSFARALLADPRILILDEATASIDTRTELLIQEALQKLLKGRTSFVIAHRLSTIRGADLIVVLDHGKVIEQGTHVELMKRKGTYHGLIQAQFRFFESA